jgi:hypothetical protein
MNAGAGFCISRRNLRNSQTAASTNSRVRSRSGRPKGKRFHRRDEEGTTSVAQRGDIGLGEVIELQHLGILGDIPWGNYFCHLYETRQDLVDFLIPYVKLRENNEFGLGAVSDPFGEEETKNTRNFDLSYRRSFPKTAAMGMRLVGLYGSLGCL